MNFNIGKYEVHIVASDIETQQVVFELAFHNHVDGVLHAYKEMGGLSFHYVSITGFSWEDDLSPWPASGLVSKSDSFGGQADAFVAVLGNQIVPEVIRRLSIFDPHLYLVGYSLAGLCTLYSGYHLQQFDGLASVSGALWYPDFADYVESHNIQQSVKKVYISLGDKEYKTRNPHMSTVQTQTERIGNYLTSKGVDCIFELNPGNHFKDEELRIAKGIAWLLG